MVVGGWRRLRHWLKPSPAARRVLIVAGIVLAQPAWIWASGQVRTDVHWRTAPRHSMDIAPLPAEAPQALVQVWQARAYNWRGTLGVHTWIALKPRNADHYTTLQVIGWRVWSGRKATRIADEAPDRSWFGHTPELIDQICGPDAEQAIPHLLQLAQNYPEAHRYHIWPGPNSNTFIAYLIRHTPQLRTELPATAIGKDYLLGGSWRGEGLGGGELYSLAGLLGASVDWSRGAQLNLLGATFGVDWRNGAIDLPFHGRIGARAPHCQARRATQAAQVGMGNQMRSGQS
ncbi:DUF3750 domain-containing protein [Magnetofaba australis]|uniref:DUF3750 domain-containing protein n=1 Tax=Magnetofaba australis TaxID=1472297 RepID=UPI00117ED5F1|nr:DUF3750 domain-containing protein [Magnetofaba australis]